MPNKYANFGYADDFIRGWYRDALTEREYRSMMQSIDDLPIPGREEYRKERIAERKLAARQTEGRKFRY